jgi:hypothetical protein
MEAALNVLESGLRVVSELHPTMSLLNAIFQEVNQVKWSREQCRNIADRAKRILEAIDGHIRKQGGSWPVKEDLVHLQRYVYSV